MIFNIGAYEKIGGVVPGFTYTGNYKIIEEGANWRIKLTSSGIFIPKVAMSIDVFCVGGGGAGGLQTGGGGGGYTTTGHITLQPGNYYNVVIGAGGTANGVNGTDGGTTEGFGFTADGGKCPKYKVPPNGGSGGGAYGGCYNNTTYYPGGNGGSDGNDGGTAHSSYFTPGVGQHTTTREFGESGATLYGGGGSGGAEHSGRIKTPGTPGDGGGGTGDYFGVAGTPGIDGLGGGGGGGNNYESTGHNGGCGIVIIRNAR